MHSAYPVDRQDGALTPPRCCHHAVVSNRREFCYPQPIEERRGSVRDHTTTRPHDQRRVASSQLSEQVQEEFALHGDVVGSP